MYTWIHTYMYTYMLMYIVTFHCNGTLDKIRVKAVCYFLFILYIHIYDVPKNRTLCSVHIINVNGYVINENNCYIFISFYIRNQGTALYLHILTAGPCVLTTRPKQTWLQNIRPMLFTKYKQWGMLTNTIRCLTVVRCHFWRDKKYTYKHGGYCLLYLFHVHVNIKSYSG